jgi:hypothetical protein
MIFLTEAPQLLKQYHFLHERVVAGNVVFRREKKKKHFLAAQNGYNRMD